MFTAAITCPVIPTAHVVIVNQTGDQLDDSMTLDCESGYRYVSGSIIRLVCGLETGQACRRRVKVSE